MNETIVALATPPGKGAIGVIRLSGAQAIEITDRLFQGKKLSEQPGHTLHFGRILDGAEVVDEVVVSLYRAPKSYTGEDVVEISAHGSSFILQRILALCLQQGASMAAPGAFTQRAFLNGKMDLTQSEAVADLIASESQAAHRAAMHQLRGGFSKELHRMRDELIHFTALIELELDFSQEDVAFADRTQLRDLLLEIQRSVDKLIESFRLGNAVRQGVSVAIIGKPNAGKSTLLNALLQEERAIVSDIAGTTRDTVEEVIQLGGISFRFIDTAGIRSHTSDLIEQKGIERSLQKASSADIVIALIDGTDSELALTPDIPLHQLVVINKADLLNEAQRLLWQQRFPEALFITAREGVGIAALERQLTDIVSQGTDLTEGTMVTNSRHHAALLRIAEEVGYILEGLDAGLSGDLLTHHIRQALHYIGEITGVVQVDRDILGAIFGRFCIGK